LIQQGQVSEALAVVSRGASIGDLDSLVQFAVWHLDGRHMARNLAGARRLLRSAVELGHVDAALMEIALTANGSGAPANWVKACDLLRNAARADHVAAHQLALLKSMQLDDSGAPLSRPRTEQIGTEPNVTRFARFLSAGECAHIAQVASDLLEPSVVVDPATGRQVPNPVRTSHGGVIGPAREDLVVRAINRRIAAISRTHVDQGEPLAVLHYAPGQQYRPHLDALPGEPNQRIRTVLIYLNQGYGGGGTHFPINGLTVTGRAGDAIMFDNCLADGTVDSRSQHAGLPVTHGAKWLATRWIRAKPYDPWR
jgi:prolyl 4-hydroxylase